MHIYIIFFPWDLFRGLMYTLQCVLRHSGSSSQQESSGTSLFFFSLLFFHSRSWVPAHSPNLKRERKKQERAPQMLHFPRKPICKGIFPLSIQPDGSPSTRGCLLGIYASCWICHLENSSSLPRSPEATEMGTGAANQHQRDLTAARTQCTAGCWNCGVPKQLLSPVLWEAQVPQGTPRRNQSQNPRVQVWIPELQGFWDKNSECGAWSDQYLWKLTVLFKCFE